MASRCRNWRSYAPAAPSNITARCWSAPAGDPNSPLERALARLGTLIEERLPPKGSGGTVEAT